MNKSLTMALLLATGSMLAAQDTFTQRLSGGVSVISTYGDYRAFTHQSVGFGGEVTCDITRTAEPINFRGMLGFMRVNGKRREDLATTFSLNGVRAGLDTVFATPSPAVRAYAGLTFTQWSGHSSELGVIGALDPKAVAFTDHEPKFGFRVGVEMDLQRHLMVALDYNQSEWRHDVDQSDFKVTPGSVAKTPIKGFNPVNPSWVAITLKWRM